MSLSPIDQAMIAALHADAAKRVADRLKLRFAGMTSTDWRYPSMIVAQEVAWAEHHAYVEITQKFIAEAQKELIDAGPRSDDSGDSNSGDS